jgi:ubiquinone/menaquinone biosynthesis C-methylase UbiE
MTHKDHVALIKNGIDIPNGVWADLGSGTGAFTLALRDVSGENTKIFSVDRDVERLDQQRELFTEMFGSPDITYLYQDFTEELSLPQLDGIIMANSLHYIAEQQAFLLSLRKYLKPDGRLLLVEYNSAKGNQWVPYPVPFEKFSELAKQTGFQSPKLLATIPSEFLNEIYSAVARY